MRAQLLRSMGLKSDKNLPDSHVEGQQLPDDRPVRFVWDKTPRGSSHNAAMKIRVIKELKENRVQQYRYVPESEFKDATVEGCFDQVFSTFRAKFKTQRDEAVAANRKQREETKAQKSRRVKRKKTKQASRTEMRRGLPIFSHSTFDPALQLECMSSEESCPEHEQSGTSNSRTKVQILKIRGLPWRIDKAETTTPTKERSPGLPKEGFQVPPKAIAGWMLSRRWLKEMREEQPDWAESLRQSAADSGDFDWDKFDTLGVETEEESDVEPYIPRSGASSLAHALAPAVG
ncbi:hypothetical protein QCA50_000601 [Cerrena zonata]|uniref:Uncharacterized protein n=1 Tax=Cerrena zonata TaxID=2478898 RepID=A0AAW0GTF1_9APHY